MIEIEKTPHRMVYRKMGLVCEKNIRRQIVGRAVEDRYVTNTIVVKV